MAKKGSGSVEAVERRHPSDSAMLDPETLDSKMHYRFVQERPTQMMRAKLKGYRVVRPSEDGVRTILDQEDGSPEDIIKHGDRVLMVAPKEVHEQHRTRVRTRAEGRLRSHDENVRRMAKERGVKLHEIEEEDD